MTIVYVLIGLVVVFAVIAGMQPGEFAVTRSAKIAAPPDAVFELVNDLHKFQDWSPWAKLDPNGKITFDGPVAGPGASFAWSGNNKVGEGRMTVTECHPNDLVRMKLEFVRPMKGVNSVEFAFKPDAGQTEVKWTMSGQKNFGMKAFGLFVNCDKMIGGDFEKGLANMKTLAEGAVVQR